jgi:TPP-dependent pyruvate/acetoin dehydrogenase alpha subunit
VSLVYFGDGATSTGAFHVAANLAAVSKAPCIFLCRNNGWAISTPRAVQTAARTFAQKAIAYGIPGIIVDGNDALAMIHATAEAAARARRGEGATLIEARTYRRGAHSSSDDPSVYRDPNEPKEWEPLDPLVRLRRYLERKAFWSEEDEQRFRTETDRTFVELLREVEKVPAKPPLHTMFDDVFAERPWHLDEQEAELQAHLDRHGPRGGH